MKIAFTLFWMAVAIFFAPIIGGTSAVNAEVDCSLIGRDVVLDNSTVTSVVRIYQDPGRQIPYQLGGVDETMTPGRVYHFEACPGGSTSYQLSERNDAGEILRLFWIDRQYEVLPWVITTTESPRVIQLAAEENVTNFTRNCDIRGERIIVSDVTVSYLDEELSEADYDELIDPGIVYVGLGCVGENALRVAPYYDLTQRLWIDRDDVLVFTSMVGN